MDDEVIVGLFLERSERAIAELSRKYGGLMLRIAMNALGDRRDAEECVNDAMMAVWNAVPPAKPSPLLPYVCRIVRNIAINRYFSRGNRHRRGGYELCLDELDNLLTGSTTEEAVDELLLAEYLDGFLADQSELNRMLFVRRFWYMDSCADIARAAGMKPGAVRTRLSRIKAELRDYLKERGVEI